MKHLALFAIRLYQRFISPYKGYRCAYACHTGNGSCSALGYRAIRRFGVWDGLALLDRRLARCGAVVRSRPRALPSALQRQAGSADCSCDLPSWDNLDCACDIVDSARDCSRRNCCDWRRRNQEPTEVDFQPRTRRRR